MESWCSIWCVRGGRIASRRRLPRPQHNPERGEMGQDLRGILFDLDGVLYNSGALIPGAIEAVRWVRERGIPHLYVTNTTSRARAVLAAKLSAFGFEATESEILSPCVAAANWLRTRGSEPIALFVRPSTLSEFDGLNC